MNKTDNWLAETLSKQRIAAYQPFNAIDGEGMRCSVYVSGCLFNCKGCYNKVAQSFNYGTVYSSAFAETVLEDIGHEGVRGLSLLGGEPFLNTQVCLSLVKQLRARYGKTRDVWIWTGYRYEELCHESADKQELLAYCDVLVDGKFEQTLFRPNLPFRGSLNQQIIDVKQSREQQRIVLYKDYNELEK